MNKYINRSALLLLLIFSTTYCVFSQVCKISETNDTVEVFAFTVKDNSMVEITVSNDSQQNSANVTVLLEVTYKYGSIKQKESYEGKGLAKANSSSIITIPINPNWNGNTRYTVDSVAILSISGSKCL